MIAAYPPPQSNISSEISCICTCIRCYTGGLQRVRDKLCPKGFSGTGDMAKNVHLRLRFPLGGAVLDYRAETSVAQRVAAELSRHGVDVSIDDNLRNGLADLPHPELWSV